MSQSKLSLPLEVKKGFNNRCCSCPIQEVNLGFSEYRIKYNFEGDIFTAVIDLQGNWKRKFKIINIDTLPEKIISLYELEIEKADSIFENTKRYDKPDERFKKMKFHPIFINTLECHVKNNVCFYQFPIQRNYGVAIHGKDSGFLAETIKINISLDGEVLPNSGTIIKRIDGKPLQGITYRINEPTSYKNFTSMQEYSNNKKNGFLIQYFNYPDSIYSVNYFEDNVQKGPYFSYYRNGNIKETGYDIPFDKWTVDGIKYEKNIKFDSISRVFIDNAGRFLDGKKILSGASIYFSKGKVDSADFGTIFINYIEKTRRYEFQSGNIHDIRYFDLESSNYTIYNYQNFTSFQDLSPVKTKYKVEMFYPNSDVIKESGSYEFNKKTGNWKYYNDKGEFINEINH